MKIFKIYLVFILFSLIKMGCAGYFRDVTDYPFRNVNNGFTEIRQIEQYPLQFDHLENTIVVTSSDYINNINQVSFAAPVGAQHPNQKPQPEPQPPPYRNYYDHTIYINNGIARSYVHSQRSFN